MLCSPSALILYGPTWRPKHERYQELAALQNAHPFDSQSQYVDPQLIDWRIGDFRIQPTSPARRPKFGLQKPAVGMGAIMSSQP